MYNLIAAAIQINADYSIFDLYGDKGFWKGYFASALITFPIVIVLILMLRSGRSPAEENGGTQAGGSRKETDDMKKQLAALREQLNDIYEATVRQSRFAAEKGDAEAQFALGRGYELGSGVPKDLEQAAQWYRKAAEQGHAEAQYHLGLCYESGSGVPKNLEQAAEWYRKATGEGHSEARFRLLLCDRNNSDAVITVALPGDVDLALVKIEAGTFMMGSPSGEKGRYGDEKQHQVTLTRDFLIGRTEVTQAQWKAVMGDNPSEFEGDDRPVEYVSWHDAMKFCKKLNEMGKAPKGWKFTLPTEAQWEYAARGGNKSRGYKYSGSNDLGEVAWYNRNSGSETHPVAAKRANELGLYDMCGNVEEWCLDWYDSYGGSATDPTGPATGSLRVRRGGSWCYDARYCRSADRGDDDPGLRCNDLGFRLALVPVD